MAADVTYSLFPAPPRARIPRRSSKRLKQPVAEDSESDEQNTTRPRLAERRPSSPTLSAALLSDHSAPTSSEHLPYESSSQTPATKLAPLHTAHPTSLAKPTPPTPHTPRTRSSSVSTEALYAPPTPPPARPLPLPQHAAVLPSPQLRHGAAPPRPRSPPSPTFSTVSTSSTAISYPQIPKSASVRAPRREVRAPPPGTSSTAAPSSTRSSGSSGTHLPPPPPFPAHRNAPMVLPKERSLFPEYGAPRSQYVHGQGYASQNHKGQLTRSLSRASSWSAASTLHPGSSVSVAGGKISTQKGLAHRGSSTSTSVASRWDRMVPSEEVPDGVATGVAVALGAVAFVVGVGVEVGRGAVEGFKGRARRRGSEKEVGSVVEIS